MTNKKSLYRIKDRSINEFPYNRKTAFRAAISLSLTMAFIIMLALAYVSLDKNSNISFSDFFSIKLLVNFIFNIAFVYYLFIFQFNIVREFTINNKRFYTIIFYIFLLAIVIIISPIISRFQWRLFFSDAPDSFFIAIHLVRDLIVLLFSFLYTSLIVLLNKNQEKVLENKNLEIESLQNRYNMLKNQVDPHFLFNSLNTLNGLIGYDAKLAKEYVNQLSKMFRYTMQENRVVMLNEELKFIESYIYMMKMRYGDSLSINIKIDSMYLTHYILPFGLQILIENAVKHNVISQKQPLVVSIATTDSETILVENNLQPKRDKSKSNGLGLANLNERYWLMFDKSISIKHEDEKFFVEIPLIDNIESKYN